MARIEGVPSERAGLFTRVVYWFVRRAVGKVTEPMAVAAHSPPVLRAVSGFEFWMQKADGLDPRLKALVAIKGATLIGCPF